QVVFVVVGKLSPSTVSPTANLVGSFTDLGMVVGMGLVTALLAMRFLPLSGRVRTLTWVFGALGLLTLALVNSKLIWVLVTLVALGLFIEAIMKRRGQPDDDDLDGVATLDVNTMQVSAPGDSRALAPSLVTIEI